jgi:hypothetical protein
MAVSMTSIAELRQNVKELTETLSKMDKGLRSHTECIDCHNKKLTSLSTASETVHKTQAQTTQDVLNLSRSLSRLSNVTQTQTHEQQMLDLQQKLSETQLQLNKLSTMSLGQNVDVTVLGPRRR